MSAKRCREIDRGQVGEEEVVKRSELLSLKLEAVQLPRGDKRVGPAASEQERSQNADGNEDGNGKCRMRGIRLERYISG